MREIFIPATITDLTVVDPNEIRNVELALPRECEVDGTMYPIIDEMRPGTAFLAKPFGARTERQRRRMYTRSNSSIDAKGVLQTIINDTHAEKADTSIWWQTNDVAAFQSAGETIPVRVNFSPDGTALVLYENSSTVKDVNLRLEPDAEWPNMRFVSIALSTGITPFLAHLRYMRAFNFGRADDRVGVHYTLVVSVKTPSRLMAHRELCALESEFPENVSYHPVLTRVWTDEWSYGRGRIMNLTEKNIDLDPLLEIASDLQSAHVRICGNREACSQLKDGLNQYGLQPRSFRAEAW